MSGGDGQSWRCQGAGAMPAGIAGQGGSGRRLEMHEMGWGQCRLELQVGAATVDFYWQSRKGKDASRLVLQRRGMAQIAPCGHLWACLFL